MISEANKTRQKRLISKADEQLDADIADVFSEDTDSRYGNGNSKSLMIVSEAEPEMENITEVAKRRKFNSFRETNGSRKGQLISECLFDILNFLKNQRKFDNFLP